MPKGKKSPSLAAILNFLIWGLGYLYLGKRTAFGLLLVIGEVFGASITLTGVVDPMEYLVFLIFSVAFAVDAYQEAK